MHGIILLNASPVRAAVNPAHDNETSTHDNKTSADNTDEIHTDTGEKSAAGAVAIGRG